VAGIGEVIGHPVDQLVGVPAEFVGMHEGS
jgi:hypothetical protein